MGVCKHIHKGWNILQGTRFTRDNVTVFATLEPEVQEVLLNLEPGYALVRSVSKVYMGGDGRCSPEYATYYGVPVGTVIDGRGAEQGEFIASKNRFEYEYDTVRDWHVAGCKLLLGSPQYFECVQRPQSLL